MRLGQPKLLDLEHGCSPLAGEGLGRGVMEQQEFAKHLRHRMTDSENKLWRHLRAHRLNGKKFRRQQPIGPYVVDFVHFGARLIVEADGGQHNDAPHDERRDAWLRTQGFKVLRFWNNEIMSNLDGVLITVMAALNELPPPLPNPSPARGEGLLMPLPNPSPARGEGRFPSREKTCPSNP